MELVIKINNINSKNKNKGINIILITYFILYVSQFYFYLQNLLMLIITCILFQL